MITPTDLKAPAGDIGQDLLREPGTDGLDAWLQAYIDRAYARSDVQALDDPDPAARLYVYHLAYEHAATERDSEDTSKAMEGMSKGRSYKQHERLSAKASSYLAQFEAMIADAGVSAEPTPSRIIPPAHANIHW